MKFAKFAAVAAVLAGLSAAFLYFGNDEPEALEAIDVKSAPVPADAPAQASPAQ